MGPICSRPSVEAGVQSPGDQLGGHLSTQWANKPFMLYPPETVW